MRKNLPNILLICALIGFTNIAHSEELTTIDGALKENFKTATAVERKEFTPANEPGETIPIYIVKKNQQPIGYALEHAVKGKWGPIHYLLVLDPQGKIFNLHVLSYQEKRGRPVAQPRFVRQFIGKTIQNPLRLKKDIHGVTGATISSRGITDGVRKLLAVFEEFRE